MSSLPKTYKAAIFEKQGQPLTLKDIELKHPEDGQILVKVEACGVCHSDKLVQDAAFGPLPRIPGHEIVGKVVEVGPHVTKWKNGDRVGGAWHGGHDGTCRQCNQGLFQMCDNGQINGVTRDGGCVTVYNAIRKMNITAGEIVAIQGLGGLGHLAVQYASKMGYRTVALSRGTDKKDFATKLGATDYIDTSSQDPAEALQKLGGASLVVATAPNPEHISPLVGGCRAMGKLLILAPVGDIPVNSIAMITKGISVHGWPSGHALDSEDTVAFSQRFDVKCMCETFPLAKANEAFEHMMANKARFRAVLTM
ncbi:hypothetical protein PHSY_003669 [Pseudozyma hubeiensis SY62]|uniref:Enoyl reductase (ER) domain-containing protein n=1 Tax=Pseudozyma hubeiensis (strain SY62) TaxID=1305764 RepID=R9PDA3_PSEHS|nr:hypothetical protein PHSY_003669 [Pseudozyma hubeiensis SY62]GAC96090.1 hypothetical protein PHSY_003669 [Pseudozyma hubeiensis SY62]